jgi:hypothetical protein
MACRGTENIRGWSSGGKESMTAGLELVASSFLTKIAVDAIWEGKECGREVLKGK